MPKHLVSLLAAIGGFFLAMVLATNAAWAEKRVALVVGNSNYQTVPQLPNPSRDATAVAKMFRDAGFDTVDTLINVGNLEFKRAIRKFETIADQADIAVVYYAGHGVEISGVNYLIPVDARLASDRDSEDEAIPLERLVASADGAKRLRLIVLDACRDNPFVKSMRRERKTATRAVSAGLGKVEPTSTDTLIAYAAKAGSTADDGDGLHSPFTTAVLKNLTVPGLDVRLAFGRVRDEVLKTTDSRQEPFVYGALGGGNIALVPAPTVAREAPASENVRLAAEPSSELLDQPCLPESGLAGHGDGHGHSLTGGPGVRRLETTCLFDAAHQRRIETDGQGTQAGLCGPQEEPIGSGAVGLDGAGGELLSRVADENLARGGGLR